MDRTSTTGGEVHAPGGRWTRAARTDRVGSDHSRLTPDVDKEWVEAFVLEQRLLGVPGDRIGDALALVQSHVAESGEIAADVFGDPTAYARESAPAGRAGRVDTGWLLGTGLGLVGLVLTTVGAGAWLSDDRTLDVTVGLLVTVLLAVAAFTVVVARTQTVLRLVVDRPWRAGGVVALWMIVAVAVLLVLDAPLLQVPAPVSVGAGVLLLVAGTVLEWRTYAAGALDDPIVGPGETGRLSTDRFTWLTVFLFPVLAVMMVALTWGLSLLA